MTEIEKIMDRIRKLLALSKSANEHEAARAAERAQALLARYNLQIADLDQSSNMEVELDSELKTDAGPWRRALGSQVAPMFFCRYLFSGFEKGRTTYDEHWFIGAPHNIVVAKLIFIYLCKTVDRLAREGARKLPASQRSPYRVSFRNAATLRLCARIRRRIDAAAAGTAYDEDTKTTLPALLDMYQQNKHLFDAWIGQNFESVEKKIVKFAKYHELGWNEGYEAGDRIGLDEQVGGSDRGRLQGPSH